MEGKKEMTIIEKKKISSAGDMYQDEVRNAVIAGLAQIQEGKTKDLDMVFDRLEKKYQNAGVRD